MGQQTALSLILDVLVGLAAGAAVFAWWLATRKRLAAETVGRAEAEATRLLQHAKRDADAHRKEAELAARERAHEIVVEAERSARAQRDAAETFERTSAERTRELSAREHALTAQAATLDARESALREAERANAEARTEHARRAEAHHQAVQRLAGMTRDDARAELLRDIEQDARREAARLVSRLEHDARATAADRARQLVTEAIQRSAAEHAIETTVSVVDLPGDDMKGRIIGREGRNIRALEQATGVELIVDDTPGAIILSSFDPFRREVARQCIERLIADGRIHPARIEEVVEKVRHELDERMRKDAEAAASELHLFDIAPELLRLMGKLRFRTSYGQNVLSHSQEVARLGGIMARELGLDAAVVVRAGFLHDIGKAVDRDMDGTHLTLGLDLLRKHGERQPVIDAVAAHHMDIDWPSLEAMIVQASDAISAARPGARRDILESYVKRLEKLEGIADSFTGVAKSFALQAGREVRVLVQSEKVSDEDAVWLSKDIARRIEHELQYPGQIKVTVIRETRAVDIAH